LKELDLRDNQLDADEKARLKTMFPFARFE